MNLVALFRWMALIGWFGLFATLLAFTGWLQPPEALPRALALAILLVPLLFPLRGILHARRYTHAWASLLALAYITLGITLAANADERLYGGLVTFFSLAWFTGCLMFVKLDARRARAAQSATGDRAS